MSFLFIDVVGRRRSGSTRRRPPGRAAAPSRSACPAAATRACCAPGTAARTRGPAPRDTVSSAGADT
ncbi:hypothetical protein ACFQ1I_40615 [Kitasatospora arboriphila]